jgi:hypothetical protein
MSKKTPKKIPKKIPLFTPLIKRFANCIKNTKKAQNFSIKTFVKY